MMGPLRFGFIALLDARMYTYKAEMEGILENRSQESRIFARSPVVHRAFSKRTHRRVVSSLLCTYIRHSLNPRRNLVRERRTRIQLLTPYIRRGKCALVQMQAASENARVYLYIIFYIYYISFIGNCNKMAGSI